MIKGACLCGDVQYELNGELDVLAVCHCDQCKRAQGTAFVTNAPVDGRQFKITQGQDKLSAYESSSNKFRYFCSQCGSPIYSQRTDMPEQVRIRVGTVTHGHIPKPSFQIYCEAKASWLQLDQGEPQYPQGPTAK
ncbi:MAG: GFA family protein [Gammaproteobacteria bacterium]|nr:GFA family protein [Gammaproteobacteria bacterium]